MVYLLLQVIIPGHGSLKSQTIGSRGRKLTVEKTTTTCSTNMRLRSSTFPVSRAIASASSVSGILERLVLLITLSSSLHWRSSELFSRTKLESFPNSSFSTLLFITASSGQMTRFRISLRLRCGEPWTNQVQTHLFLAFSDMFAQTPTVSSCRFTLDAFQCHLPSSLLVARTS